MVSRNEAAASHGETSGEATRPIRIVVLNDEKIAQYFIKAGIFSWRANVEVLSCYDGDAAAAEIPRFFPDLLITDWAHRGKSVLELMEWMTSRSVKCPLLLLTGCMEGFVQRELAYAEKNHLQWHYLNMPFAPQQIWEKLAAILGPGEINNPAEAMSQWMENHRPDYL